MIKDIRLVMMEIQRVQLPYRQVSIFAYFVLLAMGRSGFSYCGKEMLKVLFTHCLNVPLIGLGYIKAAAVKITARTTTSFISRT